MHARSSTWSSLACLCSIWLMVACATGPSRLERYTALSEPARADFDKYRQFMTDRQQERYLSAPDDEVRRRMIADMRVEERLASHPEPIQRAIWSREVLVGMDKTAVFLSWGRPQAVDRLEPTDASRSGEEIWYYRRGMDGGEWRLRLVDGVVTQVIAPAK